MIIYHFIHKLIVNTKDVARACARATVLVVAKVTAESGSSFATCFKFIMNGMCWNWQEMPNSPNFFLLNCSNGPLMSYLSWWQEQS